MPPELVLPMEVTIAARDPARESALELMRPFVLREIGRLAKALAAYGAAEWFLSSVNSLMHRESTRIPELLAANGTFQWFLVGVNVHVLV
jgi:hypothetical protein